LKKHIVLKRICGILGAVFTVIAYDNCGQGFVLQGLKNDSGGSALFSKAPGETCEDALFRVWG